ncbi:ankyrin [Byssothecium circinans]|uniref:Ankyrin n=1 Tax=Byssothecium circinans TaxID=147558 RepID=A0A6A5UG01_9PLEO|nr:ankyrin [Byssothecium circinans]
MHADMQRYTRTSGGKARVPLRISWALFDRKVVDDALSRLQRTESRLLVVLQLINMRITVVSQKKNAALVVSVSQEPQLQPSNIPSRAPGGRNISASVARHNKDTTTVFRHGYSFALSEYWSSLLGSDIELNTSKNAFQKAYTFHTKASFPLLSRRITFVLSVCVRRGLGSWSNFSLVHGGLDVFNIIPCESDIVRACERGDTVAVRTLFLQREAAPNDMSVENRSLIYYAIDSGSTELVDFLIEAGAPVQSKQLLLSAWKRQPDIARSLLRTKRADVEFLYDGGYTAASFLYGNSRPKTPRTAEFLEILACQSFSQFNAQDQKGWSVLHRAAAWGTADDIRMLLQMGALSHLRTNRLSWTPLLCAVGYKNADTLRALWDIDNDHNSREERDIRGWNLLHVAVGYDNFDAISFLLDNGVDARTLSSATSYHVPPLLRGKNASPGAVAECFGEATYRRWVEALKVAGHEAEIPVQDIDWAVEEADQVFGDCECCNNWKL